MVLTVGEGVDRRLRADGFSGEGERRRRAGGLALPLAELGVIRAGEQRRSSPICELSGERDRRLRADGGESGDGERRRDVDGTAALTSVVGEGDRRRDADGAGVSRKVDGIPEA
jgi:hypothetical protein